MGFFKNDKSAAVQPVKVHYRKLRGYHGPNAIKIAHWALQVGEYFYELAEPADDVAALVTEEDIIEELESGAVSDRGDSNGNKNKENGEDDEVYEDANEEVNKDDGDSNLELKFNSTYMEHMKSVRTINGEKVPLQISKGTSYPGALEFKTVDLETTRLKPEKVTKRAIHIYNTVFRKNYDFFYKNCQAFVSYLSFSIKKLDPAGIKYIKGNEPTVLQRNSAASICIFITWKQTVREPLKQPTPPKAQWKDWQWPDGLIDYEEIIPPRLMKQLLEPDERGPFQHRIAPHKHRHMYGRSYAANSMNQAHHDMMQNRQTVLNSSVITQLQTAPNGLFNGNPSLFATPGLGLGF